MKKLILVSALSIAMASPVYANNETKKDDSEAVIGMGAGAVAGALIAGPAGAAIGGVLGVFIGKIEGSKIEIAEQQQQLDNNKKKIIALQHKTKNYHQLRGENERLNDQIAQLELQRLNNMMAMTVQFKTASSDIEPHFKSQLVELAKLLKANPTVDVDLNGFADQRGDEAANLELSKRRVASVTRFLMDQGVSHRRLTTHAFGEAKSVAQTSSFENDFFDRRVTVTVKPTGGRTQTANNQY